MTAPTTIWCDLDETLVATSEKPHQGWTHLKIGRWAILRPGARECLDELRRLGHVRLLTYAPLAYATAACNAFGLGFAASDILGQELWTSFLRELPSLERPHDVLIEDDRSRSIHTKCRFIGIEPSRVIVVPRYDSAIDHDELASVPKHVRQLLGSKPLSTCLAEAGTDAGTRKVTDFLNTLPYPHYEADPASPGLLIRTGENGTRTRGRFVNGRFEPVFAPEG